jgi:hypothetical protein
MLCGAAVGEPEYDAACAARPLEGVFALNPPLYFLLDALFLPPVGKREFDGVPFHQSLKDFFTLLTVLLALVPISVTVSSTVASTAAKPVGCGS